MPKAAFDIRNGEGSPTQGKDVKDTAMLTGLARETADTVSGDNPTKEYKTGKGGLGGGNMGAKGRN